MKRVFARCMRSACLPTSKPTIAWRAQANLGKSSRRFCVSESSRPAATKLIWWSKSPITSVPVEKMPPCHSERTSRRSRGTSVDSVANFGYTGTRLKLKKLAGTRMKSKLILVIATATILICNGAGATNQKKGAPAGASVFARDNGKFTIQLNGQTVGHEDFDLSPAGGGWATHTT